MAQLGARLNGIQKVRGSNPLGSTNLKLTELADTEVSIRNKGGDHVTDRELTRNAARRLAIIRHVEEVTGNVALTCLYFGIARQT